MRKVRYARVIMALYLLPYADLEDESSFEEAPARSRPASRAGGRTARRARSSAPERSPEFCIDFGDDGMDEPRCTRESQYKANLKSFYDNWDTVQPLHADAYLTALPSILEQRESDIQTTILQLREAALGYSNLPRCKICTSPCAVDKDSLVKVAICSVDFVRPGVEMPRLVGCTRVGCAAEPIVFSPLYVGYFPANPVQQVCGRVACTYCM